jgi:hypothetical protein
MLNSEAPRTYKILKSPKWDITPLSEDWRVILNESIAGFEERQTLR